MGTPLTFALRLFACNWLKRVGYSLHTQSQGHVSECYFNYVLNLLTEQVVHFCNAWGLASHV